MGHHDFCIVRDGTSPHRSTDPFAHPGNKKGGSFLKSFPPDSHNVEGQKRSFPPDSHRSGESETTLRSPRVRALPPIASYYSTAF